MAQKKQKEFKNNSYHTLNYLIKIDQAIRNGEYPNANKLNKSGEQNLAAVRLAVI